MPDIVKRLSPVALLIGLATGPAMAQNPLVLDGLFAGTGQQGEHSWSMRTTTDADGTRVDYPSLGCGGTWEPMDSGSDAALRFRERLTYGHENCIDNGVVTLKSHPDGLDYQWAPTAEAAAEATGLLTRQSKALD